MQKQLETFFEECREEIDRHLEQYLPQHINFPPQLYEAMRYSVFSGGKRIRPILCLAASRLCQGQDEEVMPAACAIELIHTYSLIHDDLPAMDNDDFRRGKPTCHRKFGEAIAILAGDALLTLAFELVSSAQQNIKWLRITNEISRVAGKDNLIGGQVMDILSQNSNMDLATLEYIHTHKTGALIAASTKIGAIAAEASSEVVDSLFRFGEYLGFAFQIVDDLLDGEGYCCLLSPHEIRKRAAGLVEQAKEQISGFGDEAWVLRAIADYVLTRRH